MLKKEDKGGIFRFIGLAALCFLVYLACYATKSLLSVNTPLMTEDGYSETDIGAMSSAYFLLYGVGQLAAGFTGDRAPLKYMLSGGLVVAAVSCAAFVYADSVTLKIITWGTCGFGLAFLYAPLVKSVSRHLEGRQAETCMVLLNFASIVGSAVAGVFGAFGNWRAATYVFAGLLAALALLSFIFNLIFDKSCKNAEKAAAASANAGIMPFKEFCPYWFKTGGIVFIMIAAIQGIAKNAITFWIPSYISSYLGFSAEQSSIIFTVITLIAALNQIIAIFLYHLMKNRAMRVVRFSFAFSAVCFVLLIPVKNVWLNIVILLLAKSGYSWAGTMIWTYYCRGYAGVGRVAFVVGFLDFVSYLFSAAGSALFSNAIESLGWTWLIAVWGGLMALGTVAAFLFPRTTEHI